MSDFDVWLRQACFQEPPKHCRDLTEMAWTHQENRIEALERAILNISDKDGTHAVLEAVGEALELLSSPGGALTEGRDE